ncbi:hypothetical protein [Ancrocorticia sp.]|uniref:hypothetical protein n=1 Tax=Ancrocorticia sp. TaxID=2593684 RepID=UPI003F8DC780
MSNDKEAQAVVAAAQAVAEQARSEDEQENTMAEENQIEEIQTEDVNEDMPSTHTPNDDLTPNEDTKDELSRPDAAEEEAEDRKAQKPHSEAAKYRVKLREAEAERDTLREQVREMRTRDVTAALNEKLDSDMTQMLWDVGLDPLSFVSESGELDEDKIAGVISAVSKVGRRGPGGGKPMPKLRPTGGTKPSEDLASEKKTWSDALNAGRDV